MKQIIFKNKVTRKYVFKRILMFFLILIFYIIGLCGYTSIFLFPSYHFSSNAIIQDISIYWYILVPIISFVIGILHVIYKYTGSLKVRTIVMLLLCIYILLIPILCALII